MLKCSILILAVAASASAMGAATNDSANLKPAHSTAFAEGLYAAPASGGATASAATTEPGRATSGPVATAPVTAQSGAPVPIPAPAIAQASATAMTAETAAGAEASGAGTGAHQESQWGTLSDVFVAIGTLLLAAFTYLLWQATRGLLREAKTAGAAAEASAQAAKTSANAAVESTQAMIASEQPRWLVTEMSMTLNPIAQLQPRWSGVATVTLRNIGHSAAEVTTMAIAVVYDDLPATPDYSKARIVREESFGNTVQPGQNRSISEPIGQLGGLTEERVAAINGGKPMWLYGYIEYRDYLDRLWVKGFIGHITSTAVWYPYVGSANADDGGGTFQPVATGAGLDAYTYIRLKDGRA